jgi:16S rRNA (cytosine967-C5)-methyltransferase
MRTKTTNNSNLEKNARQIAVRILTRVEKDNAYANLLLRDFLSELEDARDRRLISTLVNGVLKNKLLLDYALRRHLRKPMSALPFELRAILRIGAFQILFLTKIPPAAAINEAVNLCKNIKHAGRHNYPALVNSVLRRTAESGWNFSWPDKNKQPWRYLAIRYSHPEWLVKRWQKRWGTEETEQLLKTNNEPSSTIIRVNTLKTSREELIAKLEDLNVKGTVIPRLPDAIRLEVSGGLEKLSLFKEGYFTVQDESSQLVAHILGVRPGQRVLDTCSAPGGKTTHLAQLMQNKGEIIAVDIYPQKLELVEQLADRLGISIIRTVESDARKLEGIEGKFDRVLVDAPCSGLGVIRRRADLRWQKREDEIEKLPELQMEILLSAAGYVAPGGELVYSTCTTEPEENFELIKAFRRLRPEFKPVDMTPLLPFAVSAERDVLQLRKGVWQILPHLHGMDGFFIAKLKREIDK